MSGAEAVAVINIISSVITIIEASRDLYNAATSTKGVPEAFRAVSSNVPLVLDILRDCERVQERADQEWRESNDAARKTELEESARAVEPVISDCEDDAKKLKRIFEKVVPEENASRLDRYRKAVQAIMPDRRRKVEDLMKDILEKLQLLQTNQFYKSVTEDRSKELDNAIQQLSELPPSLQDDEARFNHYGPGPQNVNTGEGTQRNYNQSGGSNNKQYNAKTQNFGKD